MNEKSVDELLKELALLDVNTCPRDTYEKVVVEWRAMRKARLEANRIMEALQKKETALKSYALEVFRFQNLPGILIDGRVTALSTKNVPTVSDKEALLNHIKKTGDLALLQFRLASGTVEEYRENDISVPGVEFIDVYDLTDTQFKK